MTSLIEVDLRVYTFLRPIPDLCGLHHNLFGMVDTWGKLDEEENSPCRLNNVNSKQKLQQPSSSIRILKKFNIKYSWWWLSTCLVYLFILAFCICPLLQSHTHIKRFQPLFSDSMRWYSSLIKQIRLMFTLLSSTGLSNLCNEIVWCFNSASFDVNSRSLELQQSGDAGCISTQKSRNTLSG